MMESTGLNFTPHEYQYRAIQLLVSQGAGGLFLDPGLGKTVCVLSAFMVLQRKGLANKMLVVAPLRVASKTWPDEIEKWAHTNHFTYVVLHGPEKLARLDEDVDIYIINPEGLLWLFDKKTILPKFDVLCIDESSKFKNSQTQRFKLLKPNIPLFERRWILTGTPVPNGLIDLFGQLYILDLGRSLGRYITHYRMRYFYQNPWDMYTWLPRPSAHAEIVKAISPLILQLSAEDYLKMPDLVFKDLPIQLPPAAMKIYKEVEDDFISALESEDRVVAANAAVAGGKCRQIANGAVYVGESFQKIHDAKLDALEDLLEELGGAPVLLLYEFRHDAARIIERFGEMPILGGNLSESKLSNLVDRFNAGSVPILLGHPASMGHGLNLQGSCRHVIWFGIPWNLEHYDQAIARIYRQGQKAEAVIVYHLMGTGTADERVLKALGVKDKNQQTLLAALADTGYAT